MSFFKKLFKISGSSKEEIQQHEVNLSLDDSFVHHFIQKGGKFLYSTKMNEVIKNLNNILIENNWEELTCTDHDLMKFLQKTSIKNIKSSLHNPSYPFFTTCEHLIADNGDILFTSNQLRSNKIASLSNNFIVYATTSQLVKNISEGLTAIKTNFSGNIPTNISAVKNYVVTDNNDDFLKYGNTNSKNLYLLLFEDL